MLGRPPAASTATLIPVITTSSTRSNPMTKPFNTHLQFSELLQVLPAWEIPNIKTSRRHCRAGLLLTLALLLVPVFHASAQTVAIPDPGLEAAIRYALGKPTGDITVADMETLTSLDACCLGIESIEGLGAAKNLTTLNLSDNPLTSLTLPAGLTSLVGLSLRDNCSLINLSLPADLTSLTYLDACCGAIKSIRGLGAAKNLTTLNLWGNQLTSLTLPAGLTSLGELYLQGNPLTNLALPADL